MRTDTLTRHVHFADQVGLSLCACREFQPRDRPKSIRSGGAVNGSDDDCRDDRDDAVDFTEHWQSWPYAPRLRKFLLPSFPQPACMNSFYARVEQQHVCLENIITRESQVVGTALIENLAYEKRVFVRYTTDAWKSFAEVPASYASSVRGGALDRFSFVYGVPEDFPPSAITEFAIRCAMDGQQFWDNNRGLNYAVQCYSGAFPCTFERETTEVAGPAASGTKSTTLSVKQPFGVLCGAVPVKYITA